MSGTGHLFDDASLGGLSDLLDDVEVIDTEAGVTAGILWGLRNHVAAPLALAIERALEWIADIESALVADGASGPSWRPLAEACFASQSELERALDELTLFGDCPDEARERCSSALGRTRRALAVVMAAADRRGRESKTLSRVIVSLTEELREGPLGVELAAGTEIPGMRRHPRARTARGTPTLEVERQPSHEYFAYRGIRFERARNPFEQEPSSWDIQDLDDVELA